MLFIRHNQIFPLALVERVDYSNPITGELFYNSIFTSPGYQHTSRSTRLCHPIKSALKRNYYFRFISSTLFFNNRHRRQCPLHFFTLYFRYHIATHSNERIQKSRKKISGEMKDRVEMIRQCTRV